MRNSICQQRKLFDILCYILLHIIISQRFYVSCNLSAFPLSGDSLLNSLQESASLLLTKRSPLDCASGNGYFMDFRTFLIYANLGFENENYAKKTVVTSASWYRHVASAVFVGAQGSQEFIRIIKALFMEGRVSTFAQDVGRAFGNGIWWY